MYIRYIIRNNTHRKKLRFLLQYIDRESGLSNPTSKEERVEEEEEEAVL